MAEPLSASVAALTASHWGRSGVQLIDAPGLAIAVRLHLIRAARHSIDLQYYIWRDDVAGNLLLEELIAAAQRGVQVRLLIDDFETKRQDRMWAAMAAQPNIRVRMVNPWRLRRARTLGMLLEFSRLNRRMHNKAMLVDGVAAVVGGRNIGDVYFDDENPHLAADLDALMIGAITGEIAAEFDGFWQHVTAVATDSLLRAGGQLPGVDRRGPRARRYLDADLLAAAQALFDGEDRFHWGCVQLIGDCPDKLLGQAGQDALLLPQLLLSMGSVTQRLLLISAYFVPGRQGMAMLQALAQAGVTVDVLTNSLQSNNVNIVHAGYWPCRRPLIEAGVRLWEMRGTATPEKRGWRGWRGRWQNWRARQLLRGGSANPLRGGATALHAKSMAADSRWLFVGSFNFDQRSWRLNSELGFLIDAPVLAQRLETAVAAELPEFAWRVELANGRLGWREGNRLLQPEPFTTPLKRLGFAILSRLPIAWLL